MCLSQRVVRYLYSQVLHSIDVFQFLAMQRVFTRAFDPGAFRPPAGDPRAARTRSIGRRSIVGRRLAAGYSNGMRPRLAKNPKPQIQKHLHCIVLAQLNFNLTHT